MSQIEEQVDPPSALPPRRQVSTIVEPNVKAGLAGSTSNLINSIVGSGIIGLPYALNESGIVAGILMIVLVSYFTDKTLRMIVELATYHPDLYGMGVKTYEDMLAIPFGTTGRRFIMIAMFIMAYGAMISYMIIVKDTVPTVLGMGNSWIEREGVMVVLTACTMLPLSMMRDISQLACTSALSVTADVILVIVLVIEAPIQRSVSQAGGLGNVLSENVIKQGLFVGLGVLSTAMACQHSAFLISGTLEDPTASRWAIVTKQSLLVAGSLSLTFAVMGYLGYLDETQGDILRNFDPESTAVNAGRILLAITMIFTYPMESFVCRHVLMQLVFSGDMDNTSVGSNGESIPESKFLGCLGRRETWTFYLYLAALIPAILLRDIGPVLSITGSLGASSVAYIAPGLAYLGLHGSEFLVWSSQSIPSHDKVDGGVELPVAGDATAELQTESRASASFARSRTIHPWWWYPALMPMWTAVASKGALGTKQFVETYHAGQDIKSESAPVIRARKRDLIWSIVFIVFGVVAATLGLVSNIVFETRDIFFSPH
jgi:sodium-coupled neutral amino acid transporter 11